MHALLLYAALVSFGSQGQRLNPEHPMALEYYDLVVACDSSNKCWMLPQAVYPGKTCDNFRQVETRGQDSLDFNITCTDQIDGGAKLNVAWAGR